MDQLLSGANDDAETSAPAANGTAPAAATESTDDELRALAQEDGSADLNPLAATNGLAEVEDDSTTDISKQLEQSTLTESVTQEASTEEGQTNGEHVPEE